MSSTSGATPAWEQTIRRHTALSIFGLKTGAYHVVQSFESAQVTTLFLSEDPPLPDDVKNQLTNINAESVTTVRTDTGTYTDSVKSLQNTPPNQDNWKNTINNARTTAIQNFTDRINQASDDAIDTIQNLPPSQQNTAANLFSSGMSIVNSVVNKVSEVIGTVIDSIKDFLKGIWDKITQVWNDVTGWCSDALSTLGSMFGFVAVNVLSLASSSGAARRFTGFIGWNGNIGMKHARVSFDEILDRLDGQLGISMALEQLSVEQVPDHGACIIGRVLFGPNLVTPHGSPLIFSNLEDLWQKAVNKPNESLTTAPLPVSQQTWQSILGGSSDGTAGNGTFTPVPGKSTVSRKFAIRAGLNTFADQPTA